MELWSFLNRLGTRRDLQEQDLATAMREFIQEFEHTSLRMSQMLYGATGDNEDGQNVDEIFDWLNFVFRCSMYSLLSGWIDDKQDDFLLTINVNLSTGESSENLTGTAMKVPKKYRNATKRL